MGPNFSPLNQIMLVLSSTFSGIQTPASFLLYRVITTCTVSCQEQKTIRPSKYNFHYSSNAFPRWLYLGMKHSTFWKRSVDGVHFGFTVLCQSLRSNPCFCWIVVTLHAMSPACYNTLQTRLKHIYSVSRLMPFLVSFFQGWNIDHDV